MSDIPEDVIETARVLNLRLHSATELGQRTQWIAEALMAERERSSQLLSEADKREREGLQRIANMADTEAARLLERWTSDKGATPDTKAAGVASHLITDFGAEVLAMLAKIERGPLKKEGLG